MASLLNKPDDEQEGTTPAISGSTAFGGGSTAPTSGTTPPQSVNAQPPTQADVNQIVAANQGFDFSPLLGTLQGYGTDANNAITQAQNSFNTALGAKPTFGDTQRGRSIPC